MKMSPAYSEPKVDNSLEYEGTTEISWQEQASVGIDDAKRKGFSSGCSRLDTAFLTGDVSKQRPRVYFV